MFLFCSESGTPACPLNPVGFCDTKGGAPTRAHSGGRGPGCPPTHSPAQAVRPLTGHEPLCSQLTTRGNCAIHAAVNRPPPDRRLQEPRALRGLRSVVPGPSACSAASHSALRLQAERRPRKPEAPARPWLGAQVSRPREVPGSSAQGAVTAPREEVCERHTQPSRGSRAQWAPVGPRPQARRAEPGAAQPLDFRRASKMGLRRAVTEWGRVCTQGPGTGQAPLARLPPRCCPRACAHGLPALPACHPSPSGAETQNKPRDAAWAFGSGCPGKDVGRAGGAHKTLLPGSFRAF